ncbi:MULTISPECIES: aldose 1-epimerase family protein [Bradyrhizobium]|jgi:galactose mutarotase-like enzyme|uniref:Galactose mutarotase n=2 Tax=Bradyrhizobium TaxID=374 RepID=A0ABY0PBG1_9BRAD|nr:MULTISPECIES: aldose 1-epimerase family protein [Bradyrhizobium]SDH97768.1 Galactose mutarotase [Bradyrhizobium ottawaense]SED91235.1 Galactose mutarotase [Bradyrhizobium lablabi]SHL87659.1 Galactose mutarotase [Bradyrhizobium lablabi]
MTDDRHSLRSNRIAATIKADGAELCSLRNAEGLELLWQAGEAWPRHSPLLFPIVGRLKNDELLVRGKTYPMTQHGVARDHRFEWLNRQSDSCTLVLTDNAATRSRYPFAFRLEVTCTVKDADLDIRLAVTNTGNEVLPASIGAHPAFNWPLLPGLHKQDYALTFSHDEPASIRRLKGGLMLAQPEPTPIGGKILPLSEKLFDDDAVILDHPASTSVRFAADRGPSIEMSWDGFRELGIWSKPGGVPFLCIEPWHGFASPVEFDGEFTDKPGLMHIAPSATRSLSYRIRIG